MRLHHLTRFLFCLVCMAGFPELQAATFTSADGAFTVDMPAGWSAASSLPANTLLILQKGNARIDIKQADCTSETCIEQKINSDLVEVKRKNMQVIGNSYTGEEIKRIEFSTGEPFFYISFFSPKSDFGAGYFLINSKSYSVLARNLTYAETDLIFSFISPVVVQPAVEETPKEIAAEPVEMEMNLNDPRAYDIAAAGNVEEETLTAPLETEPTVSKKKTASGSKWAKQLRAAAKRLRHVQPKLISSNMPPYIRHLGHWFDVFILLVIIFCVLQLVTGCVQLFRPKALPPQNANPNSLYPIHFVRLYGTPSLIFRAKDNQGNILISLSSRWDSLFLLLGMLTIIFTLLALALTGLCQNNHLLPFSAFTYNMLYTAYSLLVPLGLVFFGCGLVWSQLVLREISLFNHKGHKVAIVLQKGFGLTRERYEIYFARSKEVIFVTRKRFSWLRTWQMYTREGQLLAQLKETSLCKAIIRKLCGHLWGLLRADYSISGQMDTSGSVQNAHRACDRFTCQIDKPQAIQARDLLVLSLLVNIRDRDKWYPWLN